MNRELLERNFDPEQIKQRKGDDDGKMYSYIEGASVVQRLNDVFESDWSFQVMSHQILDNEVLVLGKLVAAGVVKMQFGTSIITRRTRDKSIISIGDDLKKAGTDSLKKCATLLGVGLHLYFKKDVASARHAKPARPARAATPPSVSVTEQLEASLSQIEERRQCAATGAAQSVAPMPAATPPLASVTESDRITAKQLSAIVTLSARRGWTQTGLRDHTMERFQRMPDQLTRDEAAALISRLQLQQAVRA